MVAVAVAEREVTKPKGRTMERWIAECEFMGRTYDLAPGRTTVISLKTPTTPGCPWNERKDPTKHKTHEAAIREAAKHAIDAGHVGAMAVTVRNVYKPRELDRVEIVTE